MKNVLIFLTVMVALVWVLKPSSPKKESDPHALSGKLVLTGSSTVAPLALELAKQFEARHPGVRIDVQTGGSSRGIADARQGLNDIGMVSRALKDNENDLMPYPIAQDGICLIVHQNNPLQKLSDDQVLAIYRGQISDWSQLGGPAAKITVVNKAEGRSTLELFLKYFNLKNKDIKADIIIGDNEQGVKTVAGNPHAIAYVSIGTAEYNAAHQTPIKLLPMKGVAANRGNVSNGSFPLSRTLTLVTRSAPQGLSQHFLKFAQSADAFAFVESQYFIPYAAH